jgi:hypothetical protein
MKVKIHIENNDPNIKSQSFSTLALRGIQACLSIETLELGCLVQVQTSKFNEIFLKKCQCASMKVRPLHPPPAHSH